jgi:hypothetical protein
MRLVGPTCFCKMHRGISLSFRFEGHKTLVYWNNHHIRTLPELNLAEIWALHRLPVGETCTMTVGERKKKCCDDHRPQVGLNPHDDT